MSVGEKEPRSTWRWTQSSMPFLANSERVKNVENKDRMIQHAKDSLVNESQQTYGYGKTQLAVLQVLKLCPVLQVLLYSCSHRRTVGSGVCVPLFQCTCEWALGKEGAHASVSGQHHISTARCTCEHTKRLPPLQLCCTMGAMGDTEQVFVSVVGHTTSVSKYMSFLVVSNTHAFRKILAPYTNLWACRADGPRSSREAVGLCYVRQLTEFQRCVFMDIICLTGLDLCNKAQRASPNLYSATSPLKHALEKMKVIAKAFIKV